MWREQSTERVRPTMLLKRVTCQVIRLHLEMAPIVRYLSLASVKERPYGVNADLFRE
jgi:hypothetical protein